MKRWALVTAGAQGLGGAISRHLADAGYSVLAHYNSTAPKDSDLVGVKANLSNAAGREALLEAVGEHTDRLSVLVNNLGVYPMEKILDVDVGTFESTFALTCTTNFHVTRLALPLLRAAGGARVINIGDSSCDRIEAHAEATPYYIGKIGVHVLTRTFAQALMPEGITVNMVSPGFLENSVGAPWEALPAGRKGRSEDITNAIDFLLSDAASQVSGTNLLASGAYNLG